MKKTFDNPPIFEQARKRTSAKYRNRSPATRKNSLQVYQGKREDRFKSAVRKYFAGVERKIDDEMQHGPVRVIIRDGKPV